MHILGISCFYHDSAAVLLRDGEVVAAAQEERFTRVKHDAGFPRHAIRYCLEAGGIGAADLDYVGFYDKPLVKFERILTTYLSTFPRSLPSFLKSMPVWLKEKLWVPQLIRKELAYRGPILFTDHHMSHAASAFFASPFEEAAILTIDGVGEWSTATLGRGQDRRIELFREIRFPHSLGLLYSAFTYYLGFRVNSAEYKVMGLAPYGEPIYADRILQELVHLGEDGGFHLDMKYFGYDYGLTMTNRRFHDLFGAPPRPPESEITQFHKDVAASIQRVTEEIVLRMARFLHQETGEKNLCMAGGVALNCVANGRLLREGPFEEIFIQPAAGDAGGAFGVASFIHHQLLGHPRQPAWQHAFYGPEFSDDQIRALLKTKQIASRTRAPRQVVKETAALLADQKIVGWFQGRMEFGPRALGARSILADPRNPEHWQRVNLKIKFRESFRPFAPAVLDHRASDYFELDRPSPYMLLTARVRHPHAIPAVTHVDESARVQTVSKQANPLFYDLLVAFEELTDCPVLLNTSFNLRGEPIVCSPEDAYRCFARSGMEVLVLGNFLLTKEEERADEVERVRQVYGYRV